MTRVTLWVDSLGPQPGGIGRYTWELCKRLPQRNDVSMRYFGRNRVLEDPGVLVRRDPLPSRRSVLRTWWDTRELTSSIVHGPNYFLPAFAKTGVITVHDLSVFRFPETHPPDRIAAFARDFHVSLKRAAHVITDTETVRRDLIDSFAVPPETVTAVPLGVSSNFSPARPDTLAADLNRWGFNPKEYGLCVSTLEPRKKISELLAAWRGLPRALRDRYPLVLCGGAGWLNDQMRADIDVGVAEGWLRHLGFVEETHLPTLYAGAALFIYPSIYEGFGLPTVEAMASGVPILVADRSCLPEVCGDAARYVDPDDANNFITAIVGALTDQQWQQLSVQRGLARASELSWDRCIDRTVQIYHKVASAARSSHRSTGRW